MTHYHSYSTNRYDNKWMEKNSNTSALGKVQKQFWFTKSAVIRKFGKREDESIVASDAELDAKIDLFKAIEASTKELQILLADYQNKICILAQEENALGRLLKEYGKQDQTRAGKMMLAVGKSLSYTAQQRVALRNPLVRLFQEVDTFQSRAVDDTCHTVEEMEKVRTEYRGSLMWMKNISQDFNPDHYQQLEKFREVQNLVKQKKSRFDQMKIKILQKIELLAASRCNMFSHALILYQNNLITFSEKTAKTLNSVASNFKGYHPYRFHVIKELVEPIGAFDDHEEETQKENEMSGDDKTFFDSEYHDEDKHKALRALPKQKKVNTKKDFSAKKSESLVNLFTDEENSQLLPLESDDLSQVISAEEENSSCFSNVDLMTEAINVVDPIPSSTDLLKELFESTVNESIDQPRPVFGNGSNLVGESGSFGEASKDEFNSKVFLPSHLLELGLNKGTTSQGNVLTDSFPFYLTGNTNLTGKPNPTDHSRVGNPPLPSNNPQQNNYVKSPSNNPQENNYVKSPSNNHAKSPSNNKSFDTNKSLTDTAGKVDWYKVFQDIDPLADPGNAIFGKNIKDKC